VRGKGHPCTGALPSFAAVEVTEEERLYEKGSVTTRARKVKKRQTRVGSCITATLLQ